MDTNENIAPLSNRLSGAAGILAAHGYKDSSDAVLTALRVLVGLPDDAIAGGWTARGISAHAKELEQRLSAPAEATQAGAVPATTALPDGSGFSVVSLPLPKDHWLYAPRCREWDEARDTTADTPHPILTHEQRDAVVAAVRYAIRGATMCGRESDFDPDALVQNAVYALCGPFTSTLAAAPQAPVANAARADLKRDVLRLMHLASIGGPSAPNDGGEYNRLVASIRAALGE